MKRNLHQILVACLFVSATVYSADYQWTHFGNSYYSITQDYSSWQEAQDEAALIGGHLAVINSEEENNWLTHYIKDLRARGFTETGHNLAWIGYHLDGTWQWINGDPVTYTNYYPGWPYSGTKAYLHGEEHTDGPGEWNANWVHDTISEHQVKGIIEISVPGPVLTLTLETEPNDIGINTIEPVLGEHGYTQNMVVKLSARPFAICPDVYEFNHWEGDVSDTLSSDTLVQVTSNKTVKAVYVKSRSCGDLCHPNDLFGDYDHNCLIDLNDLAEFSRMWLTCSKPECD